jgi:hypothetical protein
MRAFLHGVDSKKWGTNKIEWSIPRQFLYSLICCRVSSWLSALLYICQIGIIFKSILEDLGHPQPQTPVHCNNATAVSMQTALLNVDNQD